MKIVEKRTEIIDFIKNNCESESEFVLSLSKNGVKALMPLFGLKLEPSCKLDLESLRIILIEVLKFYSKAKEETDD